MSDNLQPTCPFCGLWHPSGAQCTEDRHLAGILVIPKPTTDFDRCVETKLTKDGIIQISCKLGNWSVSGRDREQVEREARHYWIQYFGDGEYNSLLSNNSNEKQG